MRMPLYNWIAVAFVMGVAVYYMTEAVAEISKNAQIVDAEKRIREIDERLGAMAAKNDAIRASGRQIENVDSEAQKLLIKRKVLKKQIFGWL